MYTLHEQPQDFAEHTERSKVLAARLCELLTPEEVDAVLPAESEHLVEPNDRTVFYRIKEGAVRFQRDEFVVFIYDDGDLIGLDFQFALSGAKFVTDFAVVVDRFSYATLASAIKQKPEVATLWSEYASEQLQALTILTAGLMRSENAIGPSIRHYEQGDVIIEQGSQGDEVFTLVEGHADVFVDNVKVGVVLREEIFGVLAALTGTERTAKVVATEQTLVSVLPKDNFVELIEARPTMILKVVEDMARTIVDLNAKVVTLSNQRSEEEG